MTSIDSVKTLTATRLHGRDDQWVTDRYRSIKADLALVEIRANDGTVGYAEACSYGNPLNIERWVSFYAELLEGRDVDDWATIPKPTGTSFVHKVGSAHDFAVAGIDGALWDIRGKIAGQPVAALLTGEPKHEVQLYASGGVRYDWRNGPESLIGDIASLLALGYSTVKIRLGTAWEWDGVDVSAFASLVTRVREELGGDFGLAIDGNSRLTLTESLQLVEEIASLDISFLEEPMDKTDLASYEQLAPRSPIRLSGGESFATLEQYRPWFDSGVFSIVQPDAGITGISELMAIGRMADRYAVSVIPHSWHNGLMIYANAQAVAALPNGVMVEECMVQGPLKWGSVRADFVPQQTAIDVSSVPGIGAEPDLDYIARHPYIEGHYAVELLRESARD